MEMRPQSSRSGITAGQTLTALVVFLFFVRGFCTVLIETLVPKLKSVFDLSYAEVMLTQLCFFLGYFFLSLPAAAVLTRLGYVRAIMAGLAVMAAGCLIFSPAALLEFYPGFLLALFVLASGITILQVATNPLISALGPPRSSHSRLTLAHAFNSVGTTLAPIVGAWLILGPIGGTSSIDPAYPRNAAHLEEAHALQIPFLAIAAALATVGLAFWLFRDHPTPKIGAIGRNMMSWFGLLKNRRFGFGTISIFLYVGAEVSIGSILINYLMQDSVLAINASSAGQLASLYWGGAMCGRFIGSAVLRIVPPGLVLSCCAASATLLAEISSLTEGMLAAAAVIAIGLCNSIMFPTIFMMALEDLGSHRPQGSGILSMAIVGGAIMPSITGIVADCRGLAFALLIPAACYVWIAFYGTYCRNSQPDIIV
jgi:FHS family L-fucose permease-like MFS transporter